MPPRTLPELLGAVAAVNAHRIALVEGETELTYRELERAIVSRAKTLHARGVEPGDRVAVLLPNGVEFVTTYFAIVALGAIVVPLNDQYQEHELLHFLQECDVSALVTARSSAPLCDRVLPRYQAPCPVLFVDDDVRGETAADARLTDLAAAIDPNAPVMYQFSSGSTGRPKRIARSHANLLFELDSLRRTLGIGPDDRFLGVAPFSHVNGLMRSMMASLSVGASLFPVARFERQAVVDVIERQRLTVFIAVPFMFTMLARSSFKRRPDLASLRLCISASAPMPAAHSREFRDATGRFVRQLYGSSETGTISVNLSHDIEDSLDSVGTPVYGVEVDVLSDDGRPVPADEMGEFAVRSPGAISGYIGLDDVNRDAFRNGSFLTGDLGRRDARGLLYLIGRKKFFINKGGYKIDPREIEDLLMSHPSVEEAVVLGVPTAFGDEKVKAVIVRRRECSEEDLVEHCRNRIANFKIPSVIEFRESIPKSPAGKVRRTLLL